MQPLETGSFGRKLKPGSSIRCEAPGNRKTTLGEFGRSGGLSSAQAETMSLHRVLCGNGDRVRTIPPVVPRFNRQSLGGDPADGDLAPSLKLCGEPLECLQLSKKSDHGTGNYASRYADCDLIELKFHFDPPSYVLDTFVCS